MWLRALVLLACLVATSAHAAITLVDTVVTGSAINGGNVTLTSPAGLAQNDVCYVVGGHENTSVDAGVSTAGWTELVDTTSGVYRYSLSRKVMGASPDASVTGLGTGDAADGESYTMICLRGVDTTTPEDATVVTNVGSGANPNADPVTTVTDQAWVLVLTAGDSIDVAGITLTSYTVTVGVAGNDTRDSVAHIARREGLSIGTEDPAAFAGWTISDWVSSTVAVRPAGAGGGGCVKRLTLVRAGC